MKNYLFLTGLLLCGFVLNAAARQIQVNALSHSFSPSSFTANIGDSIKFVWNGGTHTTTSTTVPAGAASWNAPLDANHTSYIYVVKIGGGYNFKCIYHEAMGMVGSFKVAPRTKVTLVKATSVNSCSNINSLKYICTESTPPFKVQLYRYGVVYGSVITVPDTLAFTVSNLPLGSYYATALGNNGTDTLTGKSNTSVLMPVPANVVATNISGTKATIKWNHYTCVKFYTVQYRKAGVTTWTKKNTSGNKDSLNITGLLANTKYEYHVAANDSANKITATGKYSPIASFTTTAALTAANDASIAGADTKDARLNKQVTIYPNPATTAFIIRTNGIQFISAQLRSANGVVVWSAARNAIAASETITVNTSKLPAGTYFLLLVDNANKQYEEKLVIKK